MTAKPEHTLEGKRIAVALSGGIACYKSATLVSRLVQRGAEVRVLMTKAATQFIAPLTLQSLSGKAVLTSMWDHSDNPESQHVGTARWCDALVIAPCSMDMIGKIAAGLTPDVVSLTVSALPATTPLLIAPAMNADMWASPILQRNLSQMRELLPNLSEVGPAEGWQACRTSGTGRMSEPEAILDRVVEVLGDSVSTPSRQDAKTPSSINEKLLQNLLDMLSDPTDAISFRDTAAIPNAPGIYSIHIDQSSSLPANFEQEILALGHKLLYIGKSQRSIRQRLSSEHRTNASPSTFFRSIGAMLGYQPLPGSLPESASNSNFKFEEQDTHRVIDWLDNHASIKHYALKAEVHADYEPLLIPALQPLLNINHNPNKSGALVLAREACIERAKQRD